MKRLRTFYTDSPGAFSAEPYLQGEVFRENGRALVAKAAGGFDLFRTGCARNFGAHKMIHYPFYYVYILLGCCAIPPSAFYTFLASFCYNWSSLFISNLFSILL